MPMPMPMPMYVYATRRDDRRTADGGRWLDALTAVRSPDSSLLHRSRSRRGRGHPSRGGGRASGPPRRGVLQNALRLPRAATAT